MDAKNCTINNMLNVYRLVMNENMLLKMAFTETRMKNRKNRHNTRYSNSKYATSKTDILNSTKPFMIRLRRGNT
jgi:hypothetical protein